MPIDIARRPETILAYAMNGDPLPPDNGFPVRAVVPGWIGTNSIKWVGRIVVSSEPIKVKWNTTSYAMHGPDYPDDPALTFQPIKSVVALGGSVSLNDLGQFAAKWSTDKISSTGLLVPAARSGLFLESDGFTKGTKLGRVMSDTEAALLK